MKFSEKKISIILSIIVVIFAITSIIIMTINSKEEPIKEKPQYDIPRTETIDIVATMDSSLTTDATWVGTLNLVWNDLKQELIKRDIVFIDDPDNKTVSDLNKGLFDTSLISESKYYKKYGISNNELKEEIKRGIKEKFNQESDILDDLDFENSYYIFYTMLYNKFEYETKFIDVGEGKFNDEVANFFSTSSGVDYSNMIDVLYYNSKDSFAISIKTTTDDEIIYVKEPKGITFNEIYSNMNEQKQVFKGNSNFGSMDYFKAPYLNVNVTKEYNELENKWFLDYIGEKYYIAKALQTLKFRLDEKGGEISSEAGISVNKSARSDQREFILDKNYVVFIKEKTKELPYIAIRVDNISKFQ